MADGGDVRTRFEVLAKGAYFEVLLPRSSDFDAAALLRSGSPEELAKAPTRRNLFFDEKARTQLVLKTSADEDEVRSLLPSLEVVLAAHATDTAPQGQGSGNAASAPGKSDLTSVTVPAAQDAEIMVVGDQTYVVWSPTLHIPWPRARLQRPAIYFTANLNISTSVGRNSHKPARDYLTPYEPISANVLEPLNFDLAFRSKKIHLSEDRLTKITPTGSKGASRYGLKPIRGASKRAFATMPALFTRMEFTPVPDGVIASLHIETSQVIAGVFDLEHISVRAGNPTAQAKAVEAERKQPDHHNSSERGSDFAIESLTDVTYPMQMHAGDETVLVYAVKSRSSNHTPAVVHVAIEAIATLEQGSQINLDIQWSAQAEVLQHSSTATHTWSPPPSASSSSESRLSMRETAVPASLGHSQIPTGTDGGVTLLFSAPRTVSRGHDFQLKVKCINKSGRSRRFMLKPHLPRKAPQVFCATPEVMLGPLESNACVETEVDYRVLTMGILALGSVTIVDLDTERSIDIRELPDIIALEALDNAATYASKEMLSMGSDDVTKRMTAASVQWWKDTAKWMANKESVRSAGQKSSQ